MNPNDTPCRTCGKPRGENIAEGTRCAACGRRQALLLWLACGMSGGLTAITNGIGPSDALVTALVVLAAMPPAFVLTVVVHELTHALVATLLGQTVVRVIVGEGTALVRLGRPPLVVGRVVLGNGATYVLDLRREGYRWRTCTMLLVAPLVSLALAAAAWSASAGRPLPAYAAGLTVALCNLTMAIITLLPMPTFGGRVWSDLATALYVARADDRQIGEWIALAARDAMTVDVERGDLQAAVAVARRAAAAIPESPLAQSLLAFALHTAGRPDEAADVARAALTCEMDAADRAYLQQFL
jgi:Zn-dependent protease